MIILHNERRIFKKKVPRIVYTVITKLQTNRVVKTPYIGIQTGLYKLPVKYCNKNTAQGPKNGHTSRPMYFNYYLFYHTLIFKFYQVLKAMDVVL